MFEKNLLARILKEVSKRGLLRDEHFGFRPKQSTSLQLASLVERMARNFGEMRLRGAAFLETAKAFDTVCVDGLVYKLTVVNFPSYLVRIITSYLCGWTFEGPFQTATSSRRGMRPGVAPQGRLISTVFFGLYIKDMPIPFRQGGVSSLRRQHDHHRHVPQASAACQPLGIISQRCRAVAERMEDCHKCL